MARCGHSRRREAAASLVELAAYDARTHAEEATPPRVRTARAAAAAARCARSPRSRLSNPPFATAASLRRRPRRRPRILSGRRTLLQWEPPRHDPEFTTRGRGGAFPGGGLRAASLATHGAGYGVDRFHLGETASPARLARTGRRRAARPKTPAS